MHATRPGSSARIREKEGNGERKEAGRKRAKDREKKTERERERERDRRGKRVASVDPARRFESARLSLSPPRILSIQSPRAEEQPSAWDGRGKGSR